MKKYLISLIIFCVIGIMIIGRGVEGGYAVGKQVQSFLDDGISSSSFSVRQYKDVPYSEVPLTFPQEIKYIAKQILILTGIAIDRKIFALEFELFSPYTHDRISCFFRIHGDRVVRIIIKTDNKDNPHVIKLQKLLESKFPDFDVAITNFYY